MGFFMSSWATALPTTYRDDGERFAVTPVNRWDKMVRVQVGWPKSNASHRWLEVKPAA
jgi:hypothetical protein